ncbi:MAG TPA: tRNA epoxyqueuosine(34) reductase QueG [Gammaproteobacteria bacterium]|nr:tRNA epoxyqueuosine(34) reductase QueG [Gammaproteobacteria bacterium]
MSALHSDSVDSTRDYAALAERIKRWGRELGFGAVGVAGVDLAADEARLMAWLDDGRHGEMAYMARHGVRRTRPDALRPGTISVISARLDYMRADCAPAEAVLEDAELGYLSRYALGRDYHKVLRRKLQMLADRISAEVGEFGYRAFTDSAPVMEKPLARNAGLGWIGKHTNLLSREAGSWFFIGELYTDLPLPHDAPGSDHCGTCRACIDACPTGAITAPYRLDARLCISYLTIELKGSIPVELRPLVGNRIFGCDDCQLVCPWNRFAVHSDNDDFSPRHDLDAPRLVDLIRWSEAEFLHKTRGSPVRRAGYEGWIRNLAVALGNAKTSPEVTSALKSRLDFPSTLVREHVSWALEQHGAGGPGRENRENGGDDCQSHVGESDW